MTKLRYVGPAPASIGVVPLPEYWPAFDHEEPNEALAEAKLLWRFNDQKCPGWGGKPAYVTPAKRTQEGE